MRELTKVEELQNCFSDLYKDVHGFRPRSMSTEQWNSEEWLQGEIDHLDVELVDVMADERRMEAEAIAKFEKRVADVIELGAKRRETALKWIFQAEGDVYAQNDPDHFCYMNGLPYGYFK